MVTAPVAEIEPTEAAALLLSPDPPVIVDVRQHGEFATGHIAGALSLPLIGAFRLPGPVLEATEVLVVCASGHRSIAGALRLRKMGVGRVRSIRGGTAAWRAEGLPLQT
ncbi:MAG: rhodanese-like domain-containing protein [Candidatus Dormibacteraceae bacterium]